MVLLHILVLVFLHTGFLKSAVAIYVLKKPQTYYNLQNLLAIHWIVRILSFLITRGHVDIRVRLNTSLPTLVDDIRMFLF